MKKEKILLALLVLFVASAFRGNDPESEVSRTFGMCGCSEDVNAPQFYLTLSSDNTFHYVSNVGAGKIDVTGTWESDHKAFVLKNYPAGTKLHSKWKMDGKKPCITSRRGMEFSRLCEQKCD